MIKIADCKQDQNNKDIWGNPILSKCKNSDKPNNHILFCDDLPDGRGMLVACGTCGEKFESNKHKVGDLKYVCPKCGKKLHYPDYVDW